MFDVRESPQVAGSIPIEDLEVGMARSMQKVVSERMIAAFAELSSDHNPVHLDEVYARKTVFGGRIAHGLLTGALISAVIGEQLPGHGSIYLKQDLKFLGPVRPGDCVEARVSVTAIDLEKRRVTLDCCCSVGGSDVLRGEAIVLAPRRADLIPMA